MDIDTDHKKFHASVPVKQHHGAETNPPSGRTMNYIELSTQAKNTTRGSR